MLHTQAPTTINHYAGTASSGRDLAIDSIVGRSPALKSVLEQVRLVAPTDSTVLIQGETGTGKELIARALHDLSGRQSQPFQRVNCAAIPRELLESDLFGHEKGAFTGAIIQKMGRFELAGSGTMFLDEIGEMPLDLQPKLLRVLQEREFERLGSPRMMRMQARVVVATNRHLAAMVEAGKFREDLFYRLNVFPILIPPLRERRGDIPLLVSYLAQHFAARMKKEIQPVQPEVMRSLISYSWPGNIRELQNIIERAVILSEDGRLAIDEVRLKRESPQLPVSVGPLEAELADRERRMIEAALAESQGRVSGPLGAAAKLGIPRQTLDSKISSLQISKSRFRSQAAMAIRSIAELLPDASLKRFEQA